jgi:hypothetical protein
MPCHRKNIFIHAVLLPLIGSMVLHAQEAAVHGSVYQHSGKIIAGASIDFRNQETGISRHAVSREDGTFRIERLDQGHYDATVQARGYKTLAVSNIVVEADHQLKIDFRLGVDKEAAPVHSPATSIDSSLCGVTSPCRTHS